MFSKSQVITIPALITVTFLLTGCPPPASFTQWKRVSTSVEGVKAAMAECGDPAAGPQKHFPINVQIIHFQCMQRLGFIRKDGFEYCEVMKNMPACVEERQGHPLSLSQLEALPFVEDEAFHPIKPNSGRDERMQVSWRKAGASLHFSVQVANDSEALPVMYACGYAKPLGSNLDVASIGSTAKVQRCMIDHGFEPKNKLTLVCLTYPQVTGCSSTTLPR
ncbi:hypothetical protein [Pseudomonas fluorescens]|uniref:hypothetical protein n=1 Tax=Pseudomonas fluorescens TaxID=294 RepID=UPI0010ECD3E4|nr:hypothetical protein [Pseudomonas fluorescens]TCV59598.1 hypothetical protein EDB98_11949 [Pseudomonas fluorescens]